MEDTQVKTFLTDTTEGVDTAFVNASDVMLAHITEGGVNLWLRGCSEPFLLPCGPARAKRTLSMLAVSTNARRFDREALSRGGDPQSVSRAAICRAKHRQTKAKVKTSSKGEQANQRLLEIWGPAKIYTVAALRACRDVSGMSMEDSYSHIEALAKNPNISWGHWEKNLDLSAIAPGGKYD